jgi:ribosomal protein L11 methyltransferase
MSYTLTLPCTRAEAEALTGEAPALALLDPLPVIVAREPDESCPNAWEIIAYFEDRPDAATIAAIHAQVPSAGAIAPVCEELPDADWVTLSQQGLQPVHAGRFYIHTASNKGTPPKGACCFQIEASQAFGTGGHATTAGCLHMLDWMKLRGMRFSCVADIGTGTGVLAFAALALWPRAWAVASDIDPISIDVVAQNAAANCVALGATPGQLMLAAANGTDHPVIEAVAPYDLVIANILAGPLMDLAPSLAAIMAPGGHLILAGLLEKQRRELLHTYRRYGVVATATLHGEWPVLLLRKRHAYGWKRPVRVSGRSRQPDGDFGTW